MKMFVVVRKDLSIGQQAVQAGHALAEFILNNSTEWKNGTLIYLGVPDLDSLEECAFNLARKGAKFQTFREPDIGDQMTALASLGNDHMFKKYNLL